MAGVIISYKGTPISNLTGSANKSLLTGGTYCEANIEVAYTAPEIEITGTFGANAFKAVTGLTSITENGATTTIGDSCFRSCTNLTSVSGFRELTTIGPNAFYGCTALTTLPTEPTITSIGTAAFAYDTSLVKFEIPTNVTALSNTIFYGCTALTDIVIHGTVNNFQPGSANNSMTNGCTNLERVTLPGGSLGSYVLYNHKKLAEVTVGGPGNAVSSINSYAFYGCNGVICSFRVYTADGNPITHASGNFWGCNKSGSTCRFVDINDESHYTEDQI